MRSLDAEGGGQNDRLNIDKINCHFVRILTYIVAFCANALDFIKSILFLKEVTI